MFVLSKGNEKGWKSQNDKFLLILSQIMIGPRKYFCKLIDSMELIEQMLTDPLLKSSKSRDYLTDFIHVIFVKIGARS